jgi:hypothetical protein
LAAAPARTWPSSARRRELLPLPAGAADEVMAEFERLRSNTGGVKPVDAQPKCRRR